MSKLIRTGLCCLMLGLIGMPGAALADDCPAERAVYRLESEDGPFTVSFVQARNYASIASNLYLVLDTPQRPYWFTFSVSNGYSGMTLLPVTDPTRSDANPDGPRELLDLATDDPATLDVVRSLRFYALDEDLTFWTEPPQGGQSAPYYVMMPEIGLTLWYGASDLTDDPKADRDPMPRGIFEADFCRDTLPPPAWP